MNEEIISREETVGLLFKVNDIAETLLSIGRLLGGNDEQEEEDGS